MKVSTTRHGKKRQIQALFMECQGKRDQLCSQGLEGSVIMVSVITECFLSNVAVSSSNELTSIKCLE